MGATEDIKLWFEAGGFVIVVGGIVWNAATTIAGFKNHGEELTRMRKDVDKIEEALSVVATQKEQIQALRDSQIQNTKRTDDTFTRVFNVLDRLQETTK